MHKPEFLLGNETHKVFKGFWDTNRSPHLRQKTWPNNRTKHIKVRIDKSRQNSKYRLCSDRDETITHIISECSKLAQKEYKAWHDWVGKVIHWEMCKKFKFDHTNKWYMHNPVPVLESDTHKLLWDFNIQTDHLIPARRPDLIIINKKKENLQNCRLCCSGGPQNKSEVKWKEG